MRSHLLCLLALLPLPALAADTIHIGVLDSNHEDGTADAVADQLEDSTVFDFEVTLVDATTLTSADQLAGFDVVVLGSSGYGGADPIYAEGVTSAVDAFHAAGGGVVASSWMSYEDPNSSIDAFVPIDQASKNGNYCSKPVAVTFSGDHPVTEGISDFTDETTNYWEAPGPLDAGATSLASCRPDYSVVTVQEATSSHGRQVYLGGIYFGSLDSYNNEGLRSGEADQLLEQAVAWASERCLDEDSDGALSCTDDCDDSDPARFPGNPEVCDGIDNDCDEVVPTDELDEDSDGVSTCDGDCDDADPDNYPGNTEICDQADNDCDEIADNGLPTADWWPDADDDGWGDEDANALNTCGEPDGHVQRGGDCDDTRDDVNPDAEDIAGNGVDEDCDGADAVEDDADDDTDTDGEETGCGCQSGPAGGLAWIGLLPVVALLRRRRQR